MAGRNLVPMTDNESDLGSPTKRWKDVYVANIVGTILGNSDTATALEVPRSISLTGAVSGSVLFDGSTDVSISTTAAQASISSSGVVELATSSETLTGTDSSRAITPKGLYDTGYYNKGNVVGTVSQSGGVPTGAVIERGSNANGEYVKFADGTMICSIKNTVTDQAINTSYGSLYQGTRGWTFPAVFSASPVTTVGLCRWGAGASWGTISDNSATSATLRFFDVVSRSTGTDFIYSASAIGRWF